MMRFATTLVVAIVLGMAFWRFSLLGAGETGKHSRLDRAEVVEAVAILKRLGTTSDSDELATGIRKAIQLLGPDDLAARSLEDALRRRTDQSPRALDSVNRVVESLTFRPWIEADPPEGFPEFTPLHQIEVKTLPAYRAARISMESGQQRRDGGFWSLFKHIKRQDIAMTAPVRVDYDNKGGTQKRRSMEFLYRSAEFGKIGIDPANVSINVVDVPSHEVVSIGVRGKTTAAVVEQSRRSLQKWIEAEKGQYMIAGTVRVMGYNSPFIPGSRAYFEVQIPVSRMKPADSKPVPVRQPSS